MIFNSFQFLIFFSIVLAASWKLVRFPALRFWVLLLASYYFYASHSYWLILLVIFTTQVDYLAALIIEDARSEKRRRLALIVSVTANLLVLGFFKYFNFCCDSIAVLLHSLGIQADWVDLKILLPIGISFYTFQNISYTVDVYRREISAERSWVRYALIVAFFPHLISGPIVRAKVILPQFYRKPVLTPEDLEMGIFLFFRGLFKKAVFADYLGIFVDEFFMKPMGFGSLRAWLGIYAFAFQIYFDFSGYTDMAIGCAKLMGYQFPENFRRPYVAASFTDFWKRWHITLSTWLKDYLYRPLGGNRKGRGMTLRNLLLTMFLGGLWHGANWTFALWGLFHGIMLCAERLFRFRKEDRPDLKDSPRWVKWFYAFFTFQLICIFWVIFRARSLVNMREVFASLFSFRTLEPVTYQMIAVSMILLIGVTSQHLSERWDPVKSFMRIPIPVKSAIYVLIVSAVTVMSAAGERPFIYFQF